MINKFLAGAVAVFFFGANFSAAPAVAGSVAIAGGATVCTAYNSIAVSTTGDVTITACTPAGSGLGTPSFVITADALTATIGTGLGIKVTRTVTGGTAGNETLVLGSTVSGAFTPPSVSFTTADGISAVQRSASVNFSTAGSAQLTATGASNISSPTSTTPIVVSAGTGTCSGIPAPGYISESLGLLTTTSTKAGGTHSIAASETTSKATGAFLFTIPTNATLGYRFGFTDGGLYANLQKELNVSKCPGDFSTICSTTLVGSDPFIVDLVENEATCKIVRGGTYYMNVRHKTPGQSMSFILNAGPDQ
jgi:hypothetical protein